MNKAVELLTKWIDSSEIHLEVLKDRASTQKYWIENGDADQVSYYTLKYQDTQQELDELIKGISECKKALTKVEEGDNQ